MKKSLIALAFIFSLCLVVAMEDPITVKTSPENHVKVYAWTAGTGPLLVMDDGTADSQGIFTTTFFSLSVPNVRYEIMIIDASDEKIRDDKFDNQKTDGPVYFDCIPETCKISFTAEDESVAEEVVETETNQTSNETIETEGVSLTGNLIFNKDGSVNYLRTAVLPASVLVVVFMFVFFKKRKKSSKHEERKEEPKKSEESEDPEERELQEIEKKIKDKEEQLKKIRAEVNRKKKIEDAKQRLAKEESELARLKNQRIEEAKKKLNDDEDKIRKFQNPPISQSNNQKQELQKDKNVQSFVDNMRKFADDKPNGQNF